MSYPAELTSVLTGASLNQLYRWKKDGLLVPEISLTRPPMYSFRDVVALRSVVYLRSTVSLQKIKRAFSNLSIMEMTEHPSNYQFATDGKSIKVWTDEGFLDLLNKPGQFEFVNLADIYESFQTKRRVVANLLHPRERIQIEPGRLGGWPTITDTRVPYELISDLVADGDVSYDEVDEYFPGITPKDVADAVDFASEVTAVAS